MERHQLGGRSQPEPSGTVDSELVGVSCSSAHQLLAAGDDSSSSVRRWWSCQHETLMIVGVSPNPSGAPHSQLVGVSCVSATSCFAVGNLYAFANSKTSLLEQWDGTAWSIVSAPNPSGTTDSQLSAVSCTSATNCFAVGHYYAYPDHKSLVERWDGTSWSNVPGPNPGNTAVDSQLAGVSCSRRMLLRGRVLRHGFERRHTAARWGRHNLVDRAQR